MGVETKDSTVDLEEKGDLVGDALPDFYPSKGLTSAEAENLLAQWGRNELIEETIPSWKVFLMQLYAPMPIMIWIAIIIEAAIQNWPDMGVLLAIQFINATIGWYEITKAGNAIAALKASLKPMATVKRDDKWQNIDAGGVVPGDLALLGAGSAIPADCAINKGRLEVDQSALTGESLPVTMKDGDQPKMGSTATRGEVEATVCSTGMNTFFGKTAAMLNTGNELGSLQKILLRLMVILVGLSVTLCVSAFIFLMVMGQDFKESISFTVVVLVASIPIAIEIVTTATLAIGSRALSEHGAIVSNLQAIEGMAGMNILCSDKTGTLTLNKMVIQDDCPTYSPDQNQYTVLQAAALAAKWKEPPRDALDTLTLGSADLDSLEQYEQIDFLPFDPSIKRTEGTLKGPDGKIFKTTKGAPQIIAKLLSDTPENQKVKDMVAEKVNELATRGIRALAVAKTKDDSDEWIMLGILTFLDPPRPDTKETIERAMELGVDVKMITGDHGVIAKETCRQLGMGTNVQGTEGIPPLDENGDPPKNLGKILGDRILEADGFAEVFPEHKFLLVEAFRQQGFATGMTGDGVNDAPALKRADIGIAVAGATDAARAAADIVLTGEGLSVVITAIIMARQIFKRIQAFINYRIAATLQLLFFFWIEVFAFRPEEYEPSPEGLTAGGGDPDLYEEWPYFFQVPVLLLLLITVLNDGTLISIGYDKAIPNKRPDKWNLKVLWTMSIVLGAVACGSSLLLLWLMLDSWNLNGVVQSIGLPGLYYGQITISMYLKISVSDFLTLFSSRTYPGPFWSQAPGTALLCGASASLLLSTLLACFLPNGDMDEVPIEGLVRADFKWWPLIIWAYCIVFWFIQDACKVLGYYILYKFDIFGSVSGAAINMKHANTVTDMPQARKSIAVVENRLFIRKIDAAIESVEKATKADPKLEGEFGEILSELRTMRADVQHLALNPKSAPGARSSVAARASQMSQVVRDPTTGLSEARSSTAARRSSVARQSVMNGANSEAFILDQQTEGRVSNIRSAIQDVHDKNLAREIELALDAVEQAAVNVHDVVDTAHGTST
ncbi:hypothetical protein SARC_04665 [Sphaeroforma arctica JP610]|uniref:Plasma membrane ATPase n=1 Tax=Sphaeroforma arctica JP610 TaxID=667725 RepID=A0A0L0G1S9_9EUKA|nr:hypothetical protein SARC_04665 [Sphaeroforma arctica JP610]KNC83072.1 hypothetical protein SARC_04665 [Sphaeroforma arctica JP610]|eukprot:XP_014156974.1 hypothetical protein SARC_04665 [Sphaeroforma arctica JP610]